MKRSGQYRCRSSPRSSASRTGDLQNCADDTRLRCPLRGYWARIQVGQSVKRPPLPPVSQANLSTIEINFRERQPAIEGTATEGDGVPTIVVAQDRAISHPIILLIEQCFARPARSANRTPGENPADGCSSGRIPATTSIT